LDLRKYLPLIGIALLSGPVMAQPNLPPGSVGAPQALPILEFVLAIEGGAYASYNLPVVNNYAPLDFAAYLFVTQPFSSVENAIANPSLEGNLVMDLEAFNNYWILSGSSASLFVTSPTGVDGIDTPQIDAHYITNQLNNAEGNPTVKAPEMNVGGATGAFTLLFGAMLVLLGRRPARRIA
jgi:hypothetical protein